eukprot:1160537-Pelagomonas_calceolata.AAC.1
MGMEFARKFNGTLVVKSQIFKLVKGMLSETGGCPHGWNPPVLGKKWPFPAVQHISGPTAPFRDLKSAWIADFFDKEV